MSEGSHGSRLMLVTNRARTGGRPLAEVVAGAVAGGVGIVQLRESDLDDGEMLELVSSIRRSVPGEVCLVLNDRPALAKSLGLGLHLPFRSVDTTVSAPPPNPLGVSAHDADEVARAVSVGPSYLVLGTAFETASHPGRAGIGVAGIAALAATVRIPTYAIGGVTASNAASLIAAGCYGVAVSSAILEADDPTAASRALATAVG